MARHKTGRRDKRRQSSKAHAVIKQVENKQGRKMSLSQKQSIVAAAGAAPYPPRQAIPRKWARRAQAARFKSSNS